MMKGFRFLVGFWVPGPWAILFSAFSQSYFWFWLTPRLFRTTGTKKHLFLLKPPVAPAPGTNEKKDS